MPLMLPCSQCCSAAAAAISPSWAPGAGLLAFNNPTLGLPSAQADQGLDLVSLSGLLWELGKFRLDESAVRGLENRPGIDGSTSAWQPGISTASGVNSGAGVGQCLHQGQTEPPSAALGAPRGWGG